MTDHVVGEVAPPAPVVLQRPANDILLVDLELNGRKHLLQNRHDRGLLQTIRPAQHPDEPAEDDGSETAAFALSHGPGDESTGAPGLRRVVLRQIPDEDVGVEPDHRRRPP